VNDDVIDFKSICAICDQRYGEHFGRTCPDKKGQFALKNGDVEYKINTMIIESKFYKLALNRVKQYFADPSKEDNWEMHYKVIHYCVLQSNTGNTVPHCMRNRFCEGIIEHYREEATRVQDIDPYDVVCGNCGERRGEHFTSAGGAINCPDHLGIFSATSESRELKLPIPTAHITDPACNKLYIEGSELHSLHIVQPTKEETTMIKVTTMTLVNGHDFSKKSDEQCYDLIKNAEKDIDRLNAMQTQPISAKKFIKNPEAVIADLAKVMYASTEVMK